MSERASSERGREGEREGGREGGRLYCNEGSQFSQHIPAGHFYNRCHVFLWVNVCF